MLGILQVGHKQDRHVGNIGVTFLMSVQAVNGFQVVNVHKQKSEFGVLVFLEHPVIFFHVVFIAGPGSETAERVHHDLPFQYSRRILQREE